MVPFERTNDISWGKLKLTSPFTKFWVDLGHHDAEIYPFAPFSTKFVDGQGEFEPYLRDACKKNLASGGQWDIYFLKLATRQFGLPGSENMHPLPFSWNGSLGFF